VGPCRPCPDTAGLAPAVFAYTDAVRHARLVVLLLAITSPAFRAAQVALTAAEIDEAIRLGQTRIAADRMRFHQPYRILLAQAPVDYVDVVTPFRRVVLAADERTRLGDRSFGQRQALELLNAARGRFDFVIELTFHPQNTFVTMPDYGVVLIRDGKRITPSVDRRPRFGARVEDSPPSLPTPAGLIPNRGSQPMLGGTLTAPVEGELLGNVPIDVVVTDGAKELARATIDLARLR
jgi:hypothetical protein